MLAAVISATAAAAVVRAINVGGIGAAVVGGDGEDAREEVGHWIWRWLVMLNALLDAEEEGIIFYVNCPLLFTSTTTTTYVPPIAICHNIIFAVVVHRSCVVCGSGVVFRSCFLSLR